MKSAIQSLLSLLWMPLVAVLALAQGPPPPPPSPTEVTATTSSSVSEFRSGSIKGRIVTNDGQPLSQLRVNIFPAGIRQMSPPRQVQVDDDGNFQADGLAPTTYSLFGGMPGYVLEPGAGRRYYRTGDTATLTLIKGGVITGKVFNASGEPVIGVPVLLERIRDDEGRPVKTAGSSAMPAKTDDRGVYRIYGIAPGTYLVKAGGRNDYGAPTMTPYEEDVPTFYPSSARDTASEITVRSGDEVNGVDIRYRGERGHSVSGKVIYKNEPDSRVGSQITLVSAGTGFVAGTAFQSDFEEGRGFALYGVPDGEYEIIARRFDFNGQHSSAISPIRKVTVRGNDVSGIELTLASLASLSGKIVFEKKSEPTTESEKPAACRSPRTSQLEEILLNARRDEAVTRSVEVFPVNVGGGIAPPNNKGEFNLQSLEAGRWRLQLDLPDDTWFIKSILSDSATPATAKPQPRSTTASQASRSLFTLKSGEKLSDVTVTLSDGAAMFKGKVTGEADKPITARVRVFLIPADSALSEDVLRYMEMLTGQNGEFTFKHLAPGKYWMLARALSNDEPTDQFVRPKAWDAVERAKLRKEAEVINAIVELKPCQRLVDFTYQIKAK